MRLAELKAYIAKKFHTGARELADSPGMSVVVNRNTGKWAIVLMRQWDAETGVQIDCCDIKCGQEVLAELAKPYLSRPFRMRGDKWVGVRFRAETQADVVFRLLDKAMSADNPYGCQIVLGKDFVDQKSKYHETLLPQGKPAHQNDRKLPDTSAASAQKQSLDLDFSKKKPDARTINEENKNVKLNQPFQCFETLLYSNNKNISDSEPNKYIDTPIPATSRNSMQDKIREMRKLYNYNGDSFALKCKNFYVQGKFMEDFEPELQQDNWIADFRMYFPTYHDLTTDQILAYFSWRRCIRNGIYPVARTIFAYIYIYELLNEIGTSSVVDSLNKLKAFEENYIHAGYGDSIMQKNVHSWMFEFAVLNCAKGGLQKDDVMMYVDPATIQRDQALLVLQNPEKYNDNEVFQALVEMGGKKLETSSTIQKKRLEAVHLFAETWRMALQRSCSEKKNFFVQCFGDVQAFPWYPLGNAVYYQKEKLSPFVFELNTLHRFCFDGSCWNEENCHDLYFDKTKLESFLHETDRKLRLYLKTGHPLQVRKYEAWASRYVDDAIERDKAEKEEARRPKVNISFYELDKIRSDACETRDKLLTDEELKNDVISNSSNKQEISEISGNNIETMHDLITEEMSTTSLKQIESIPLNENVSEQMASVSGEDTGSKPADDAPISNHAVSNVSLNNFQIQLLKNLLCGNSVKEMIAAQRGMPEIIADAINEALYDEIGDTVVICDGVSLALVDDYRDDIEKILGETTE